MAGAPSASPGSSTTTRELIEEHALAFRKVAENAGELLADDPGDPPHLNGWRIYTPPGSAQRHRQEQ